MITLDDNHIYRNDKGEIYLSVTQQLQIAGLVDFSMVKPEDLDFAKLRGKYVHKAINMYLYDDLDVGGLDGSYRCYVEGFVKFKEENGLLSYQSEEIVFNDVLKTAGTFDFIGSINSDLSSRAYMFEIKTPQTMPLTTPYQVAAYVKLWNSMHDDKIYGGYGLHLLSTGNYRLYKYDLLKYGKKFINICHANWGALEDGIILMGAKSDPKTLELCKEIIGK